MRKPAPECRPPEGAEYGSEHWLKHEDGDSYIVRKWWSGDEWEEGSTPKQMAAWGWRYLYPASPTDAAALAEARAEIERMKVALVVPGKMRCAKCGFVLQRVVLNVTSDTVSAGDNKTEACPNGCGPLWPVNWEQYAKEKYEMAVSYSEEAEGLRERIAELEAALRFYANRDNWRSQTITVTNPTLGDFSTPVTISSPIISDGGIKARSVVNRATPTDQENNNGN